MSAVESEETSHPPLKGLAKKGQLSKESDQREKGGRRTEGTLSPQDQEESHQGDRERTWGKGGNQWE